ncbi:AAA family ATPase [Thalassospira povalilytica]|uniref:OLD family endonuclease n=1 Tax=Thalassospira povalilytica TaxID=732237 RepID=A0ABX4R9X2_9PROT|nr:AAA family ATPase [Thalassospira povalilytica]PKR50832.1 OLD family endonuclease [Thalassospira povalilytica]
MRIRKVRVQNYRSIIDSGEFDLDSDKTIMVGPNEAGKTALLQAIQHLNPPENIKKLNPLRDFPRAQYSKIKLGHVDPSKVRVVEAEFELDDHDREFLPEGMKDANYVLWRNLDNSTGNRLSNAPAKPTFSDIEKDLKRLASHIETRFVPTEENETESPTSQLSEITDGWPPNEIIEGQKSESLLNWLESIFNLVDEDDHKQEERFDRLKYEISISTLRNKAVHYLRERVPTFVLFSNYFRVRPLIHLNQLASRIANGSLDDERYDYGNVCLLNLLGFDAKELSDMGRAPEPDASDPEALDAFRAQLDERQYLLNSAEVNLTREIRSVWNPDENKGEAAKLRLRADGQYLKVTVEDDLGVEVELDQRSEGFQWLVSFFVVFFAEAEGDHKNAILLLDEPGQSLHALKQREFRKTISRLAANNQTIYTTHSPFLVGPDELDSVRVVEMESRETGTKVHTSVTANDPAALLPLQEALGYDLAQSLFTQKQNLILEGLTDYWYVDAVAALLRDSGEAKLNDKIALVPANTAGKVIYFATILHAQGFKVAALLDSDSAGEQAAKQETLIHTLGKKNILRTKDFLRNPIKSSEIEDMLRETLVRIAKSQLGWDIEKTATEQPARSVVSIFEKEITDFSKYRLAKAFLQWSRDHTSSELTTDERDQWKSIISTINNCIK